MRTLIRTAGRLCISAIFVYTGYGMINQAERYAKRAAAAVPMLPEDPMVAKAHGATMMVAGSTLALGILPRLSARVLAWTMIPNTLIGHQFWKSTSPEDRRTQVVQFMKNAGLFGGLLYLSADKRTAPQPED